VRPGGCWVVVDRLRLRAGGDTAVVDAMADDVGGEDVVDELAAAPIDPRVPLRLGDAGGEVPQSGPVALVRPGVAGGADLRAGRPCRIYMVAASGASLRSPSMRHRRLDCVCQITIPADDP
jgi:hypothetical protein